MRAIIILLLTGLMISCTSKKEEPVSSSNFSQDVNFINQYTPIIELTSADGKSRVAVSPSLQGRVMTSTATGVDGMSYGWINKELFQSGDTLLHMNPFGGEERFWLGPEGGQFGLYFKKGDPFDFDHWQTPSLIDIDPFEVIEKSTIKVVLAKNASITNYSDFKFDIGIKREVLLIDYEEPGVDVVSYQTINTLTNTGSVQWKKESGLLSIWLLGMFNPSPTTTVIIPFNEGDDKELGPVVIDDYFGKVPTDRLIIKDNVCYFKADGQYRSKIGFNPLRAKDIAGSYDAKNKVLTIVKYSKNPEAKDYVNSKWEQQQNPYGGDVVNSYNDGPASPGAKSMGGFYELETSSAAYELKPGEYFTHIQTTYHFQGDESTLTKIAKRELGVDLLKVSQVFQ